MTKRRWLALIGVVVVALAIAVVALAQANRSDTVVGAGSVAVTRDGETVRTFTMAEVEALPKVDAHKKIASSSHADEDATFRGVPLRVLIDAADPALLTSAKQVVIRAVDGYVSALDADEVSGSDDVVLAYAKDGTSLGSLADGGTGPFRLIILTDPYGNRCARYVNEIEIL